MSGGAFGRPAVVLAVSVGAISALFAVLLVLFGDELQEATNPYSNSFSTSAIGHRAFAETLRKLGIPVLVSRNGSAEKAGGSAVLLLVEPDLSEWTETRTKLVREMSNEAKRVLVVLPKRWGTPDSKKEQWLDSWHMVPESSPRDVLAALGLSPGVTRPRGEVTGWKADDLPIPHLADPQLMTGGDLEAVVKSDQGMLVGERLQDDSHLIVLADPDILSTHGLLQGKNVALAVALVERLREGEGTVVMDETIHGLETQPSIARAFFRYPLVLVLVQALLIGAGLTWAGMGRFGKVREAPPAIQPGKGVLIDNTAGLLRYGGHLDHAVHRYYRVTLEEIGREMHAPAGLDPASFQRWLVQIAAARGLSADLQQLEGRVAKFVRRERAEQEALLIGRAIHRFRQEMLHGSRSRKGD
jgi:hypothetical protein